MFHESRIEEVEIKVMQELERMDVYGSVKIYLCFYDEYLVPKGSYNGRYPCSDKNVELKDIIEIINRIYIKPHIIRHNVLTSPIPVGISDVTEDELEKYVEVCEIKNACLHR
jgi:hypothetical protein